MESSELIKSDSPLSEEDMIAINECIPIKEYKKGTVLLREGQISTESYYVVEGLLRSYYLIDGEEKTTEFYSEEDSVASFNSYVSKTPADHYFECIEDCMLAVMTFDKEKELVKKWPKYEELCRVETEKNFGNHQKRLAKFISSSPEQRYLNLLETRPELLNRVPQFMLASYLGMKPESLSRIRKRITQKDKANS